ncbi:hypothetical protein ACLOJK_026695 [Asimina triloba]
MARGCLQSQQLVTSDLPSSPRWDWNASGKIAECHRTSDAAQDLWDNFFLGVETVCRHLSCSRRSENYTSAWAWREQKKKEENATYGKMFTGHERCLQAMKEMERWVTEEETDGGILMREKLLGATTQVQSCTQKIQTLAQALQLRRWDWNASGKIAECHSTSDAVQDLWDNFFLGVETVCRHLSCSRRSENYTSAWAWREQKKKEENATYGKMFTGHERDGKMLLKMSTDCRVTEEEADDGILMREKLLGATTQVQSCTQKEIWDSSYLFVLDISGWED